MVLSKRERYVAIVSIIVVTLLLADRYIVTPFLDRRAQVETERQSLLGEMERATSLFKRRKLMEQKWQDMVSGGLESDASNAESQVLHAVRNWSQECGLMLSSMKPERVVGEGNLQEITFLVAGTGTMSSVGQFLCLVHHRPPVIWTGRTGFFRRGGQDDPGSAARCPPRGTPLLSSGRASPRRGAR